MTAVFVANINKIDGTSYQETFDEWIAAEGLARHLTRIPGGDVTSVTISSPLGARYGSYYSAQK